MGDLIKLYEIRKPKIEMLLKDESEEKIKLLKDLAYDLFSNGNVTLWDVILHEYQSKFMDSWLTVEKGEILLIYNDVPYFICKTKQRLKKEANSE